MSEKVVTPLGVWDHKQWLRFALGFLAVVVFGGVGVGFLAYVAWSRGLTVQCVVFGLISAAFFVFAGAIIRTIHREVTR